MKILITGAKGQLGNEFSKLLGSSAILTDYDNLDITDYEQVKNAPEADIIINCAAYTNVDGAEDDYDGACQLNAKGVENLTKLAEMRNIPIVHVSTDYVFDGEGKKPYTECDATNPKSVYGNTKLEGERIVSAYPKHYIVRTAWLYGEMGKNFVKTIARVGREKGKLKVVSDQFGCPTNAKDLAEQILRLIKTDAYGTYHCTGSGECSWFDFACEIIKLLGIECEVSPCKTGEFPAKAKRPAYSVLDNSKLEKAVGAKMPQWKESLEKYLKDTEIY
ncbi:MAG: dTDP-4-dehydrorhamnose reductase [Clostridia bacterium]|nr:dTDP-4-dehydrorhamnose reductase [Clostridia bacterium]